MNKRKIGLISEHASPLAALGGVDSGGQNVYVGELARHLGLLGYEVDVFTRWDDARLPQVVQWTTNVRVVHVKAGPITFVRKEELLPFMGEFTRGVLAFSREQGNPYKLFHANFFMSALVAADIKKLLGTPFVVTFHALGKVRRQHQGDADQFPAERISIEERVIDEADHIIAECTQDRDDLVELYDANPANISIVPCGVNTNDFYPIDRLLARMVLNLNPQERIILQLGRMVPRKGVDNVIEAVARLNKQHKTPARLLVVGGESDDPDPERTPEIARLSELASRLGIKRKVTFVGRKGREALKYYYSAADVFVSTPWYEPFGMTPLEAMACGTPVIGSNVGGIKFSVADGKTGYLVTPKNPVELADRLHELFSNQKLQSYFRQNALHRVNSLFTWSKVAHMVSDLYEKVAFTYETQDTFHESKLTIIDQSFTSAIETIRKSSRLLRLPIMDATAAIVQSLSSGGKVLACGNGGSATQAQHFAGELVGRFMNEDRPGLPVMALTADGGIITAWANDVGYDHVFSRQVEAYGRTGDVLVAISTSGNSPSIIEALKHAREKGLTSIALLGKSGGDAVEKADIPILVPSYNTQRIQEMHIHILHLLCELVEKQLFAGKPAERNLAEMLPKAAGFSRVGGFVSSHRKA
ncbi:MAG: glycosyltransferase [Chloroflexi bacterium]|nr:glycosyltransferase [Chloroflexota bacterium]